MRAKPRQPSPMDRLSASRGESPVRGNAASFSAGNVPGLEGSPAFTVWQHDPSPVPVVIAVPHAGRSYPPELVSRMRQPAYSAPRLEDRLVDLVGKAVAERTGAALLVAHAPRAMIDLNRASDDVDWDMVGGGAPDASSVPVSSSSARRARSGLGLVPRRLPGLGELWKWPIAHDDLAARIDGVHVPYHSALAALLESVRARWGAALLIDLHSMPPLPARAGEPVAEFVVGDRFGAACDGALVAEAFAALGQARRLAAHNRPYAGGYVLERHARRHAGVHCLQLEIDRRTYLDPAMAEPGPGLDSTVDIVATLVQRMAIAVADLGRERGFWRAAAE
ncbi:N-formylglutamate amidohydrolase [Novosphingobium sediminis]|uniref:N-formylglutamate amidohydrolase n=1 Tax=Novosphingobium sediminis TaxID=707214 RepID=A0A512AJW0_9SPHN|nr:N-formylglutamate amidohydrolase [Novosphingobium sediminis]GEN99999.1 N-formylglutamate amidohydrolase [Novosphingobium sediminis]